MGDDVWPFARTLLAYDVVDSTSDRAGAMVREGIAELPLVVWSRHQTRGRGRGSHTWWSDAGSLTFTVAIDPMVHGLTVEAEPKLALGMAVAVIRALNDRELIGPSAGIRWPNDLELDGRKFGGILPERVETREGHRVLVGVGINVLTDFNEAPADVRQLGRCLAANPAGPRDERLLPQILSAILGEFECVLERLAVGDPSLAVEWNRLDLLENRWVNVALGSRVVTGWGRGIDVDGALCLDDGKERIRLFAGQVLRD